MQAIYNDKRPSIPESIRRQVLIEAGHKCSIAGCSEHSNLHIHHINNNREDNRPDNLIALCPNHHAAAEQKLIDRTALREYKQLRRKSLVPSDVTYLSVVSRSSYIENLMKWVDSELARMESSPIEHNERVHMSPSFSFSYEEASTTESDDKVYQVLDSQLNKEGRLLIKGNGGSGKTVVLLSWIKYRSTLAAKDFGEPIPVFIPLHRLVRGETLSALTRTGLGKFGISASDELVDELLQHGRLFVICDGVNEIPREAIRDGAVGHIANFIERYPSTQFVVSTRYISSASQLYIPEVSMSIWNRSNIKRYLEMRLGNDLGNVVNDQLGDDIDFEWRENCSIAGLCSNPLTLWMIASVAEETKTIPDKDEDIIDSLVSLMVQRMLESECFEISSSALKHLLASFAYYMLEDGDILSLSYDKAINMCNKTLLASEVVANTPRHLMSFSF